MYTEKMLQKFWARVAVCEHGHACKACCWLWQGGTTRGGYGSMALYWGSYPPGTPHYQQKRAHRMCWDIVYGPIPDGLWVLHNCPGGDNPLCVNPAHLWLGTPDDNQKDSMRTGTRPTGDKHGLRLHPEAVTRGERSGVTHLSDNDVYAIRAYGRLGYSQTHLAKAFDISSGNVGSILRRRSWAHLPEREDDHFINTLGPSKDSRHRGETISWSKLTEQNVLEIRALAAQGWYQRQLAQRYGVSKSLIGFVVTRKLWKHL